VRQVGYWQDFDGAAVLLKNFQVLFMLVTYAVTRKGNSVKHLANKKKSCTLKVTANYGSWRLIGRNGKSS
jgi:hypothetical protein